MTWAIIAPVGMDSRAMARLAASGAGEQSVEHRARRLREDQLGHVAEESRVPSAPRTRDRVIGCVARAIYDDIQLRAAR